MAVLEYNFTAHNYELSFLFPPHIYQLKLMMYGVAY
jgi:hypothetical protein